MKRLRRLASAGGLPNSIIVGLSVLKLLQHAAAFVAGGCFGYGLGSLLIGQPDTALLYGALGVGLYLASILPAPEPDEHCQPLE